MARKFQIIACLAFTAVFITAGMTVSAHAQQILPQRQDPRPYAPIAVQLPDTLDQLYRDSATIKMGRVRVNQAGYRPNDEKFFYYVGSSASSFSVIDVNTGTSVATGALTSKNTTVSGRLNIRASNNAQIVAGGDTRYTMQSPTVSGTLFEGRIDVSAPGRYKVRVGSDESVPFTIDENVYSWVRDAAIKFPGVNRCGDTESWFHGACHLKDATVGGWHDCGDHLKESITQSYLHSMLALASAALRDHDADNYGRNHNNTVLTDGVPDVLYEAKHGSDYIIRAFNNAGGNISRMVTAVGGFGPDHQWWGAPEMQDRMSVDRGGPPREARVELGANVLGNFAAGLALTAKNYAVFDKQFADTSIAIAKRLYEYGKANRDVFTQTPAYSGNAKVAEKLAFAALGLAYATGERRYLNDLCYDKTLGSKAGDVASNGHALFEGGWFTYDDPVFSKQTANTDWASPHMAVKWGFFRLILKDPQMCAALGIDSTERLKLMGKTIYNMIFDVTSASGNGTARLDLPATGLWNRDALYYEDVWNSMLIQMSWMWNRYQFGNIFDLYCYSDMARYVQDSLVGRGIFLPYSQNAWQGGGGPVHDWKAAETRRLMIRQMDYMLGVNPWDVSMIYGVGAKNHNHPHHRAANPEGKNVPGAFYKYRPPVGALHAGTNPFTNPLYTTEEHYDDYFITETGIDASATMIIPVMGLAKEDPITEPPTATVRTVYVGVDRAIIEVRQSRFGMTAIRYAEDGVTAFTSLRADSNGVFHSITLTGLKPGTRYNFDALVADMFGNSDVIKDRSGEYFTFTTLRTPPGTAEITNVKVCRVTSDSAEIFWYTPNGAYDSRVVYGERKPPATVKDGNIYGRPSQFHYVKIGGLKEKTTYYFYVENNGTRDDNGGQFYEFTTPVEHVAFDIRAALYNEGGHHFIGLNVINQDVKDYDSLELRLYVRSVDSIMVPDPMNPGSNRRVAFRDHFAFRVDIGIKYRSDGFQDTHFKGAVDSYVQSARPIRMEDTYNPADNTWGFYIPVPMGPARMESGARFRLDLMLESRSPWPPYQDLMNQTPLKLLDPKVDWSFMPHSRANGDPVDYPGTPVGTKDQILDRDYWNTPINQYITVYRKDEFVWGYSPSASEQLTKKTHYELTSQITAPILNPAEEYFFMEQVLPSITVNGWAHVTETGIVNDIWVNGNRVRDVSSVAQYNAASDRWDISVPVPLRNGGNNVDITIFGGPPSDCGTCYGCAFSNHSFYMEFKGAEPYPSTMRLIDAANQNLDVRDSARIDETSFYIHVVDMNGNLNGKGRDTVYVSVVNPVFGDSLVVALIETGDSTGNFRSASPVRVVSPPGGVNRITMDGGQVIWITYADPTDPEDISQISLASRAEFAVPISAYFRDSTGMGAIDAVYVKYSKVPDILPDSLHITIPGETGARVVKASNGNISADPSDPSLIRFHLGQPIVNITGFRANEQMTARSFLRYGGTVREAVIPVQDNAGPALLEQALLFERNSGVYDTLQIVVSEPMTSTNLTGVNALVFIRDGGAQVGINVISVVDSSLISNTYTLLIDITGSALREGDSVFINPIGPVADRAGNPARLGTRQVPVVLKSSAPRITNAFYRDLNADGRIDQVELNLSKPLLVTGMSLWLAWGNGQFIAVDGWERRFSKNPVLEATTTVLVDIDSLLIGDSIITGGAIRAMATHNAHPGDTLRANVVDRAPPVIRWAQYAPGPENGKDTLIVNFSEPLTVVSARPFKFLQPDGTVYEMLLENPARTLSNTQTFIVHTIENGAGFPGAEDSVWINVDVVVADTTANIQSNADNRKVKLGIKPPPLSITVIPAPNPFKQVTGADAGQKARIIVRPGKAATDMNLKGSIIIYDRMGNRVVVDELVMTPGSQDLVYEWDGTTKTAKRTGRKVGTGTYLITATVEHVTEPWEEKTTPALGRALMYILR
ncbi:MAG: glycoside hydrolase family 9 protein [Chitinispirillia bacterium]|nr:glycoside hydrolase family 9 protein [Chitinispirillia bacterium]MCL2269379.1 glycoside hydrolase family 9 protein [Chitinispirillia bacterium]